MCNHVHVSHAALRRARARAAMPHSTLAASRVACTHSHAACPPLLSQHPLCSHFPPSTPVMPNAARYKAYYYNQYLQTMQARWEWGQEERGVQGAPCIACLPPCKFARPQTGLHTDTHTHTHVSCAQAQAMPPPVVNDEYNATLAADYSMYAQRVYSFESPMDFRSPMGFTWYLAIVNNIFRWGAEEEGGRRWGASRMLCSGSGWWVPPCRQAAGAVQAACLAMGGAGKAASGQCKGLGKQPVRQCKGLYKQLACRYTRARVHEATDTRCVAPAAPTLSPLCTAASVAWLVC